MQAFYPASSLPDSGHPFFAEIPLRGAGGRCGALSVHRVRKLSPTTMMFTLIVWSSWWPPGLCTLNSLFPPCNWFVFGGDIFGYYFHILSLIKPLPTSLSVHRQLLPESVVVKEWCSISNILPAFISWHSTIRKIFQYRSVYSYFIQ